MFDDLIFTEIPNDTMKKSSLQKIEVGFSMPGVEKAVWMVEFPYVY